jgi:hypothetical protein
MIRPPVFAVLWLMTLAGAQELPPVSGLPHAVVLRRIPAKDGWDLVVALSSAHACEEAPRPCWWNTQDRLGILLEDRGDPNKFLPLAIEPGPNNDCSTRVERFTVQELVLSCTGEKWATYDNQKFIYDVRARKLVSHYSYAPCSAERVLAGPKFAMTDGKRELVIDIDPDSGEPRVTAGAAPAAPENAIDRLHFTKDGVSLGGKVYPLPQTDLQGWQQARPDEATTYLHIELAEIDEEIGPQQAEGGLLWFGKTFYNAEGATGVGGFGYFDSSTTSYYLYAPPEIANWSVSAILVEPDAVWLALDRRGEFGNYPGGLLLWDRNTQAVRRWEMPWIATGVARFGDAIYLGLTNGVGWLRGDRIVSYFVDRSEAGQYRMAARN